MFPETIVGHGKVLLLTTPHPRRLYWPRELCVGLVAAAILSDLIRQSQAESVIFRVASPASYLTPKQRPSREQLRGLLSWDPGSATRTALSGPTE